MSVRHSERRVLSSTLSARVVGYLTRSGHTQASIAKMLGVGAPFVSLVKSRERALTIEHIERLTAILNVPIGAFMTAVTEPSPTATPEQRKLHEISAEILAKADEAREAILRSIESGNAGSRRGEAKVG